MTSRHRRFVRAIKIACALLAAGAMPFLFDATMGCSFHPGVAPNITPVSPNSYVCSCSCEPGEHHQEVRISAAFDDAEGYTNNNDAVDLDLGQSIVGVRFVGLQVPQGAPILSASVQFTADQAFGGDNTGPINLDVYGIAADNVASFGGNFVNLGPVDRTAAAVGWPIPPWSLNQSGSAQQTPNLKDIIQEIVDRSGWQSGNALALIFAGVGRREAVAYDLDPGRAAVLSVDYLDPVSPAVFDLYTCVPPSYDANLSGGVVPTDAQLGMDCTDRVQPTLIDLAQQCNYPSACSCSYVSNTLRYAGDTCDAPCDPTPVDSQCMNFDPKNSHVEANTVGNDPPICTAYSPLAADLFGQRTMCSVAGTAQITATSGSDSDTETSDTAGIVQFVGPPCPGQSCAAGMAYSLNFSNVEVGNFFESATFNKLGGIGESLPGHEAAIAPDGTGTFGAQALGAAAQGRRDNNHLQGLVALNDDSVNVAVGWGQAAPMCHVDGTLIGSVDPELKRCENAGPSANQLCQSDADCMDDPSCSDGVCNCLPVTSGGLAFSLTVDGDVLNQPPTANAGPDQNVECTAAAVTNAVLDGSNSSDPDGNGDITIYSWFRGSRVGPEVGAAPIAHIQQPIGTESYILRVIDTFGQADEDTTQVHVIDTLPPVVSCAVMTPVLNQANHDLVNVGLMADAQDQCEGTLPVTVNVFSNEDDVGTGDGNFSPDATDIDVGTLRLRAERTGNGDGRVYLIIPESTDSSGNRGFSCCTVSVPHANSPAALAAVQAQAGAARAYCVANDGMPPAGYFVIGDGPVIGPKH